MDSANIHSWHGPRGSENCLARFKPARPCVQTGAALGIRVISCPLSPGFVGERARVRGLLRGCYPSWTIPIVARASEVVNVTVKNFASGVGNLSGDVRNLALDHPHLDVPVQNLVRETRNRDIPVKHPLIPIRNPVIAVQNRARLESGAAVPKFGTATLPSMTSPARLGTASAKSSGSSLRSGTAASSFPTALVRRPFPVKLIAPR